MFQPDWLILRMLHQSFEIKRPKGHWSEVVVHLYALIKIIIIIIIINKIINNFICYYYYYYYHNIIIFNNNIIIMII